MEKTNRELNYKIALTGIFGALSLVLVFTHLGFISIGGFISITVMHIPTILVTLLGGIIPGLGVGLIFGITSLINTVMNPVNPFFLNPMVSIVPRLLIPVVTWIVYRLLNLIPKMPKILSGAVAAAFGTFANTFFVMGSIYIIYGKDLMEGMGAALTKMGFDVASLTGVRGYFAILACTMVSNGIWEIAGAVVITVAVLSSMYLLKKGKSKLNKSGGEK
ncbi:MAG: ECF transporter S component [Treponema sp.]|nr:ECF transporter S component [Treponema sp.]MBQ1661132.1 ECF transporter S component [Treponema sp.]MBR6295639.1 ECF transporter S component [Treponema sp.]